LETCTAVVHHRSPLEPLRKTLSSWRPRRRSSAHEPQLGSARWRAAFERRIRAQHRLGQLTRLDDVAPGPPRFIGGNAGAYLHDGRVQLAWMLAAIAGARHRIDLETYIYEDDATGRLLRDALVAAAQRGVTVRVLYDAVGSSRAGSDFFEPLQQAGAHVVEFNPVAPWRLRMSRVGKLQSWEPTRRNHRKLLVCDAPSSWAEQLGRPERAPELPPSDALADASVAVLGGRNVGDHYLGHALGEGQWRDCGAVFFGPVVAELAQSFGRMWQLAAGPEVDEPALRAPEIGSLWVMPLASQPGFANLLQWAMSRIAASVREELRVSSAYFIPSARWRRALVRAAAEGRRCIVLVPRVSDVPVVDAASRHLWGKILRGGVELYRYGDEILHEKTLVYDRVLTVVGSSNLDPRSFRYNYELSVLVVGECFAEPVVRYHQADVARSERYTLADWQRRDLTDRAGDWFWSLFRGQL
jgi:cardiolipin synthase